MQEDNSPFWAGHSDEELLDLKFSDLKITIENTPVQKRIDQLYEELERKDLKFRPHCWFSEEWFSPDGVPGIAIPFYLGHPRLAKLESRQMFEVEGGTERWCMQLLRHEAGHAISTAFRLYRRKRWRQLFGRHTKPYPQSYVPRPKSENYVLHLGWWYAQSHPAEDFAETFAVWLTPRSNWRKAYRDWAALRKLEYVDELMKSIAGEMPPNRSREKVEPLSQLRKTLREHYRLKRENYGIDIPQLYDGELMQLFPQGNTNGKSRSVASLLRALRPDLCQLCSRGTGESSYFIGQIVDEMILCCRKLNLRVSEPLEEVKTKSAIFITVQTINYLHKTHHRVPI